MRNFTYHQEDHFRGALLHKSIPDGMTPTPDGSMPRQPLVRFEDGRSG